VRALDTVPACRAAAQIHLVETSAPLRARQRAALPDLDVHWHDDIEQFVRHDDGWHQRLVDLADRADGATGHDPVFVFCDADAPSAFTDLPPAARTPTAPGAIIETSAAARRTVAELARRIHSLTGAALIFDYGYAGPAHGDTLQAVRSHRYADVLRIPGEVDLTAHVDFAALAMAATTVGATAWGPVDQGDFLRRLGIEARAETLAASATAAQRRDIAAALERLIDAAQMGTLFKVLAIGARGAPPPAGFSANEAYRNPCD